MVNGSQEKRDSWGCLMPDFSPLQHHCHVVSTAAGSNSRSIVVTGSATADTKGAWAELIASTPYDSMYMVLNVFLGSLSGTSGVAGLIDIGVGAASSEEVVIPNLLVGGKQSEGRTSGVHATLPLYIKKGSRIAARAQGSISSAVFSIGAKLFKGSLSTPSTITKYIQYGADTSDSGGLVVDPGGTSNTKGSWVEFASSSSYPARFLMGLFSSRENTAMIPARGMADIGIGSAGSEIAIVSNIPYVLSSYELVSCGGFYFPVDIPAASRIAMRTMCSITNSTDRLLDHAIYLGV